MTHKGISYKGNTDTLRIVQTYVKECLNIFVNDAAKLSDLHILRLPMLSFISDLCSKKVCRGFRRPKILYQLILCSLPRFDLRTQSLFGFIFLDSLPLRTCTTRKRTLPYFMKSSPPSAPSFGYGEISSSPHFHI
jgi:hypothetical protein